MSRRDADDPASVEARRKDNSLFRAGTAIFSAVGTIAWLAWTAARWHWATKLGVDRSLGAFLPVILLWYVVVFTWKKERY